MKPDQKKAKEELLAEAELMVDKLLKWDEENEAPTLTQIEDIILELRQEMSTKMACTLVESQEEKQSVPGPACAECGEEMRYKGQKSSVVESRVGGIQVERGYYYCPKCQAGHFPPG